MKKNCKTERHQIKAAYYKISIGCTIVTAKIYTKYINCNPRLDAE